MKIVFMGTPEFAVPVLKSLHEKYEVVLAVSQPNRVKKKGVFVDTPVAAAAKALGIGLIQPEKIKDAVTAILDISADVLVTAAYGQYLPSRLLNGFKACINVHASLLPKHRGGAPIQRCLMNGDTKTGVSIMQMTKQLDAGRVYAMAEYSITSEDTASSLFEKLSLLGRDLLMENISDIYTGKNLGIPQNEPEATYSPNIRPEEERIDLSRPADVILHQIRGLCYEPGAYLEVNGIKLKVFRAERVDWQGDELPGTVLTVKKRIVLKVLDAAIELTEVLMPGKKILSGRDFSNGQKIFTEGAILK